MQTFLLSDLRVEWFDTPLITRLRHRSTARQGEVWARLPRPDTCSTSFHRRAQMPAQGGDRDREGGEAGSAGDRDSAEFEVS